MGLPLKAAGAYEEKKDLPIKVTNLLFCHANRPDPKRDYSPKRNSGSKL